MGTSDRWGSVQNAARLALAGIRLFYGGTALCAPGLLIRGLGLDPGANPAAMYAFRLFGVRTVVIGAELVLLEGPERARALRQGIIIHASDTAAATLAGATRQLPAAAAVRTAVISGVNTALAIVASGVALPRLAAAGRH